jgi:ribosomal protein S21
MSIEIKVKPYPIDPKTGTGTQEGERAINKALQHLRRQMDREGVIDDVKEKRYYIKPSDKKKKAKSLAKFRQKKRDEEWY